MEPLLRTVFPVELADIVADYVDQFAVPMGKAKMACCMAINIGRIHYRIAQKTHTSTTILTASHKPRKQLGSMVRGLNLSLTGSM